MANFVTGTPANQQGATDYYDIRRLAQEEEARKRKVLEEQKGIQSTRLSDLAKLLATQGDQQFNRDIPGIASTAQGQGFLETSGFGNALSRDYTNIKQDTNNQILKQGLSDRDFEVNGIGDISSGTGDLNTSALQRRFSVADQGRSEDLARELAKYGVAAPVAEPSSMDKLLQYSGPLLQGVGAVSGKGGSHFCTKLKSLGLITEDEFQQVRSKVLPVALRHPLDVLEYELNAPSFIERNENYDWTGLKVLLCDKVLECKTREEAYKQYKSVCHNLFNLVEVA